VETERGFERAAAYENGQDIRDRTFAFACRVVRFGQKLYEAGGLGRMMVPQIVNCSTSIAAMLEEASSSQRPVFR
jgi:hypothetical protein